MHYQFQQTRFAKWTEDRALLLSPGFHHKTDCVIVCRVEVVSMPDDIYLIIAVIKPPCVTFVFNVVVSIDCSVNIP